MWIVPLLVFSAIPSVTGPVAQWPPSSISYNVGDFLGTDGIVCPPEGLPKPGSTSPRFDPILNQLKNRDATPINGPMTMKLTTIFKKKVKNALAMAKAQVDRADWIASARSEVTTYENRFVTVEGFLTGVDKQGPESCNAYSQVHVDFHLWLAPYPPSTFPELKHIKHHSMVVEISPRTLQWHQEWTKSALDDVRKAETKVRITGWLMFDQEHPANLYEGPLGPVISGKTRRTLWEIHPVHRIELWNGDAWQDL